MRALTLGACALNQWAMDFNGNHERIRASIVEAKSKGCRYRLGPELETCGYGCEDHFHESDTEAHAWEIIARLCAEPGLLRGSGVVADVGAPATMDGCRYNARVIIVDGKIALVRPKRSLADDGNYRESRWFTAWTRTNETATWRLPDSCRGLAYDGGDEVPFGDGAVVFDDCGLWCETCEELWTPDAPRIALALHGIEIIAN